MSVIQNIRDKYARVAVIAIALALLGFIAMDAFTGRSQLFGSGRSTTVGTVDGNSIQYEEFRRNMEAEQQGLEQQNQGMLTGPALTERAIENTWNREINKALLLGELNKLGINVTQKELNNSILFGNNPPEDLKRQFINQQTGQFDAQALGQQLREIRKSGTPEQKAQVNAYLAQLELGRKEEKYNSLITNSVNIPKWMLEKQQADNNQQARISFVRKAYTDIVDSTVRVSDEEISDYVNNHKNDFKQTESRSISYVAFSALPSAADSAAIKQDLETLKSGFADAPDAEGYIAKNSSNILTSVYAGKSQMQMAMKDTLQSLAVNQVFGPYLDGGSMVLAKMLDIKTLPDSVKCRHILISTNVQQGGFEDSVAKTKIDSIRVAIEGGATWDTMATMYNPDGTRTTKGEMTFSSTDIQGENFAKEFGQFILFDGKVGESKVVKTIYGWHYINIMQYIKPEPHYKIAYLMKPIVSSSETDQKAKNDASSFAGEVTDEKTFNEVLEKKWKPLGYNKGLAYDIVPSAYQVMGLGYDRDFVKKIYDAKKGEVLQPAHVNDNYVVAVVTDVFEKGTQSAAKARMAVEPLLRNRKKAEIIKKELGAITTLEQAATKLNKQVEVADSVTLNGNNMTIGYEPKLIGAAFNPASRGKVVTEPIEGSNGVYVLRVESVTATAETGPAIAERRKAMIAQMKQRLSYPLQAVREAANIKDNRSKFY